MRHLSILLLTFHLGTIIFGAALNILVCFCVYVCFVFLQGGGIFVDLAQISVGYLHRSEIAKS